MCNFALMPINVMKLCCYTCFTIVIHNVPSDMLLFDACVYAQNVTNFSCVDLVIDTVISIPCHCALVDTDESRKRCDARRHVCTHITHSAMLLNDVVIFDLFSVAFCLTSMWANENVGQISADTNRNLNVYLYSRR